MHEEDDIYELHRALLLALPDPDAKSASAIYFKCEAVAPAWTKWRRTRRPLYGFLDKDLRRLPLHSRTSLLSTLVNYARVLRSRRGMWLKPNDVRRIAEAADAAYVAEHNLRDHPGAEQIMSLPIEHLFVTAAALEHCVKGSNHPFGRTARDLEISRTRVTQILTHVEQRLTEQLFEVGPSGHKRTGRATRSGEALRENFLAICEGVAGVIPVLTKSGDHDDADGHVGQLELRNPT